MDSSCSAVSAATARAVCRVSQAMDKETLQTGRAHNHTLPSEEFHQKCLLQTHSGPNWKRESYQWILRYAVISFNVSERRMCTKL